MKRLGMLALMGILGLGLIIPCYAEKIVVEGSTTVLPIAQKAAEVYMDKNPEMLMRAKGRIHLILFLTRIARRMGYITEGQYEIFSHRLVQVGKPLVTRSKNGSL